MSDFSDTTARYPRNSPFAGSFDETHDQATDRDSATPTEWAGAHAEKVYNEVKAIADDLISFAGLYVYDNNALSIGWTAGRVQFGPEGAPVDVAADTLTMTDDDTNYLEVNSAGTVSVNLVGFTEGYFHMATVVTSGGDISTLTDDRSAWYMAQPGDFVLDDLGDVTISAPADNEVVAWDDGTNKFVNQTAAEAGLADDDHDLTHIRAGADEIDGDKLDIDWDPSNSTPATTPAEVGDVDELTAHLYGIDVELGVSKASQVSEINSGFHAWTSGADANTYTVTGSDEFQIDRDFDVYIKGTKYSLSGGVKTAAMTVNACNIIYAKTDLTLGIATSWSHALFEDNAVMFECLSDGTNFETVKENHPAGFQTQPSYWAHDVINTVLKGVGADITRVAAGAGGAAADREIKIVGADELFDHGLDTTVPDSAGAGVTWNWYYTNGAGNWTREARQTQAVMKFNDGGVATAIDNNKFGVWRMYVSKDDIESATPNYFAVMGAAQYNSQNAAEAAIADGMPEATNELDLMEMAQLGYLVLKGNAAGGYVINILIEKATLRGTPTGAGATNLASLVSVDVTNFAGVLAGADVTVQIALDTLDDHHADYETAWIDAAAMVPTVTAGADPNTEERATNDIMTDQLLFDGAAPEKAQWKLATPDNWDLGTIQAKIYWDGSAGATPGDIVQWGVSAVAVGDGDPIDVALGTEVTVDDTLLAIGDEQISAATGAITVGGTPALGDQVYMQVRRGAAEGNDDMTEDAKLLGVFIQYGKLGTQTAAW